MPKPKSPKVKTVHFVIDQGDGKFVGTWYDNRVDAVDDAKSRNKLAAAIRVAPRRFVQRYKVVRFVWAWRKT